MRAIPTEVNIKLPGCRHLFFDASSGRNPECAHNTVHVRFGERVLVLVLLKRSRGLGVHDSSIAAAAAAISSSSSVLDGRCPRRHRARKGSLLPTIVRSRLHRLGRCVNVAGPVGPVRAAKPPAPQAGGSSGVAGHAPGGESWALMSRALGSGPAPMFLGALWKPILMFPGVRPTVYGNGGAPVARIGTHRHSSGRRVTPSKFGDGRCGRGAAAVGPNAGYALKTQVYSSTITIPAIQTHRRV